MPTKESYDDHVIRLFLMAAAIWGVAATRARKWRGRC
jgi:hypothetical protein